MAWSHGQSAFVVVLAAILEGRVVEAAGTDEVHLALNLDDKVGVAASELAGARAETERIFAAAGVALVWSDRPASATGAGHDPPSVTVRIVHVSGESTGDAAGCVLGLALRARSTAYVFFNRIANETAARPVDAGVVLGRVIAHEIGHLLLPPGPHARYGIMRGRLDLGFANPSRFTDEEERRLRARLGSPGPRHPRGKD